SDGAADLREGGRHVSGHGGDPIVAPAPRTIIHRPAIRGRLTTEPDRCVQLRSAGITRPILVRLLREHLPDLIGQPGPASPDVFASYDSGHGLAGPALASHGTIGSGRFDRSERGEREGEYHDRRSERPAGRRSPLRSLVTRFEDRQDPPLELTLPRERQHRPGYRMPAGRR